jgi:hypothetical protein
LIRVIFSAAETETAVEEITAAETAGTETGTAEMETEMTVRETGTVSPVRTFLCFC